MVSRRGFLLGLLASGLFPTLAHTQAAVHGLSWGRFLSGMSRLAEGHAEGSITADDIGRHGLDLVRRLDPASADFLAALDNAWESGNRFWLWRRIARQNNLLGGILFVERGSDVPLHDHPGATGLLRVLTGELELWQFDAVHEDGEQVRLERTLHRVLRPGDTAVLSPHHGNIHALRARTRECSMLDFFIPPYERSVRSWFEPADPDWRQQASISCTRIHEADYYAS